MTSLSGFRRDPSSAHAEPSDPVPEERKEAPGPANGESDNSVEDAQLDDALEGTFPASDPVSITMPHPPSDRDRASRRPGKPE